MTSEFDIDSNEIKPRNIAVIGASGSIGCSALDVIAHSDGKLRAGVLSVNRSVKKVVELANCFHPDTIVVTDETADRSPLSELHDSVEVLFGPDALEKVITRSEIDIVLLSIVGVAGLRFALSVLKAGKKLALANKEALVAGGSLLMDILESNGGTLYPVDSEHSAIYQCLLSQRNSDASTRISGRDVERLILTASGGPFRNCTLEQLKNVTVQDALKHPTWNMGAKITIDSASMMNKSLEIIEAYWLFGLDVSKIKVMIHPQSFIHSMVEFIDGAVLAQLSPPDMRLPIQFAFYETQRVACPARKFNWLESSTFEMYPPDFEKFPALKLGFEVAESGGTSGVVLNAANEVVVDAFINEKITFDRIPSLCRMILEAHDFEPKPTLARIFELDAWARKEAVKWISR